jgi:F-type H+-transporting ATPase subunit c
VLTHILTLGATSASSLVDAGQSGLRSLAIALGGGLGAVGAGVGIGMIFSKVIESVTRQPEMRAEITSIQWLGFALTEAIFFYGLVAGLLAYVL